MKKLSLIILFFLFLPFALAIDYDFNLGETAIDISVNGTKLYRQPATYDTLIANMSFQVETLGNNILSHIGYSAMSYVNGSTAVVNTGNLILRDESNWSSRYIDSTGGVGSAGDSLMFQLSRQLTTNADTRIYYRLGQFVGNDEFEILLYNNYEYLYGQGHTNDAVTDYDEVFTFDPPNPIDFNQIVFVWNNNGNSNRFDSFSIYNVSDRGVNKLPSTNISVIDEFRCINESDPTTTFTLNITSVDPEGDTIYYGTEDYTTYEITESVDFTKGFLGVDVDDEFLNNWYKNTSHCGIDVTGLYNSSAHYMTRITLYPRQEFRLTLNSECIGVSKEFIYKLDESKTLSELRSEFFGVDEDESILINFYDNEFNLITRFNLSNQNARSLVYDWNGTNYNLKLNTTQYDYIIPLIQVRNNSGDIRASIPLLGSTELTDLDSDDVKYIGYDVIGRVYLNYFEYGGIAEDKTFTTVKPTSVSINNTGVFPYTVYVSDEVHQPYNYTTETMYLEVVLCEHFREQPEQGVFGNPIYYNFGNPIRQLISTMGWTKIVDHMLGLFGVVLFLMLVFLTWKVTADVVLSIPMFITGFIGMGLSWILDYQGWLIGYGILFVLSIAGPTINFLAGE